jgi:hypothetical protein
MKKIKCLVVHIKQKEVHQRCGNSPYLFNIVVNDSIGYTDKVGTHFLEITG